MVFIPLKHVVGAIQNQILIFRPVTGNHVLQTNPPSEYPVPESMGLQIRLVNDIQSIAVAKPVQGCLVRIMACAHRIDIIPLHHQKIKSNDILVDCTPAVGAEFMPVDAVKYHTFSIEMHDMINHLKPTESKGLQNRFRSDSLFIEDTNSQCVKIRILRAPQFYLSRIKM